MFKRIFFLQSHELEAEGVKLLHRAGYYYHVAEQYVEKLIAEGIAAVEDPAEAEATKAAAALGRFNSSFADAPAVQELAAGGIDSSAGGVVGERTGGTGFPADVVKAAVVAPDPEEREG